MKKRLFIAVFSFFAFLAQAQDKEIKLGDVLKINSIPEATFQHIELPKKNIIIKRGGVPDYKTVHNNEVVVTKLTTNHEGEQMATLKRKDGRNFFVSFPLITANVTRAIAEEEISY
ncbi:hypothetical protein [Galbibacter sp. PAP.153]|uniref:hypothetical protein n=1 Tax=Galbibacter sp. PAP.153 TaxID=3104623 RepID=UPI0030092A78